MTHYQPLAVPSLLLSFIPEVDRTQATRACVQSLRPGQSTVDIFLAASLLAECKDAEATTEFLHYLESCLLQGHASQVIAVFHEFLELQSQFLHHLIQHIHVSIANLDSTDPVPAALTPSNAQPGGSPSLADTVPILLDYITRTGLSHSSADALRQLYPSVLILIGFEDSSTRSAARNVLVTIISVPNLLTEDKRQILWTRIKELIQDSKDPSRASLAYSLWLSWAASSASSSLSVCFEPDYWSLLQLGLRIGDGERRKQCLSILRQSVAIASRSDLWRQAICSYHNDSLLPKLIQAQYDRYLTVFEAMILGRYTNQVVQCEQDLSLLSAKDSIVQSRWICTLLSAALDSKMQEANRKFVGGWIMAHRYQPELHSEFTALLKDDLLPWMTQGHLFTGTLRQDGEISRCDHGERLADYVGHILKRNESDPILLTQLLDIIVDALTVRNVVRFAYAIVALAEGLARGIDAMDHVCLSQGHCESLLRFIHQGILPEVARDFVMLRCVKMIVERGPTIPSLVVQDARAKWLQLTKLTAPANSLLPWTSLASAISPTVSKREEQERIAYRKIKKFWTTSKKTPLPASNTPWQVEALQEIWTDIDYLEYPKRLLISLINLLFDPDLVSQAIQSTIIGLEIAKLMGMLLELSNNRAYLVAPIALGMTSAIIQFPAVMQILDPEQLVLQYCTAVPYLSLDLRLEDATTRMIESSVGSNFTRLNYVHYFGHRPSVGVAALLDFVGRLGVLDAAAPKRIFDRLFTPWLEQKIPVVTVSQKKCALQLQMMIVCSEQMIPTLSFSEARQIVKGVQYVLSIEPLPSYRHLLSWMLVRAYVCHDGLRADILSELGTNDHHANPKYLASLIRIATMLVQADGTTEEFARQVVSSCISLAASAKVVIRHETQWQIPLLLIHATLHGWKSISEDPGLLALDRYIRTLPSFGTPPLERQLSAFDPVQDHNLTNLSEGLWLDLDDMENATCGRVDFIENRSQAWSKLESVPACCMPLGDPIVRLVHRKQAPQDVKSTTEPTLAPSNANESRALQTKGTAYLATFAAPEARRRDIVVVASLVDNPHNLGGISRVAEIFGASEMHLQNQNVTSNRDFQNVAVSSHLHFPIFQLSALDIPTHLAEKRRQGFAIVGIEQTDRSVLVSSPEFRMPQKVVLVVGSEKEGIPALVLGECDVLVEIPQQGLTRSLNVQTAAAIVLYEYARQHGTSDQS